MKNLIIASIAAVSLMTISSQAFAAQYNKHLGVGYRVVEGTIVSVNKEKNLFAVKDKDDTTVYGFMAWASDLASLSEGGHVVVTAEKPGAVALSIR